MASLVLKWPSARTHMIWDLGFKGPGSVFKSIFGDGRSLEVGESAWQLGPAWQRHKTLWLTPVYVAWLAVKRNRRRCLYFGRGLTTLTSMQAYTCRKHTHKYNFTSACYGLAAAVVVLVQHTSLGIYGSINSYKSKIGSCPAA